ncbi:CvpA family protein [Macrococcus carouselicus]|uniref:CvpA family protein n=1 Tax=Macrococcus carouselicus TaxID=69969 RepID=A0A9Q8CNT3_9STAP|nr:CvpA family protein [Macrococcus carouselicus]TDM04487.1 CvpA family protein [Macrococcus carouselicus]
MIDIILLFFLILGSIVGLRRGFILQSMHLIGTMGALIIARIFYQSLAEKLELIVPYPAAGDTPEVLINWQDGEQAFYNIISFIFLFLVSKVMLQMVATVFDYIAQLPLLKQLNKSLGSLLGFIESYLLLFIIFFFIAMIPAPAVQERIQSSHLARAIIEYTPILSNRAIDWFQHIALIHIF